MAYNQATYIPGGNDDFYLPEVISPAPKRSVPAWTRKICYITSNPLEGTGAPGLMVSTV